MPPEGEPIVEHLASKYGCSEADVVDTQHGIMEAAEALGLDFSSADQRRAHNTFDAHRVLAWASERGMMRDFQLALFDAYFGAAKDPADRDVLTTIAESLGLDGREVDEILDSDRYAEEVRREEAHFNQAGVTAVPAFIVNRQYLISGAREPDMLADAFRRLAQEASDAPSPT
jgi:predicted DsbA family dithiol-disulfide isomerase